MTIRIKLLDGEIVDTERHTYEQATAAKAAGVAILVGGEGEFGGVAPFPGTPVDPERTIYPEAIASIERVSA
jgi:hypothetical protein